MEEEAGDSGGALHVAGLGLDKVRTVAVFGLSPVALIVTRNARREDDIGAAFGKFEIVGVTGAAGHQQREFADAGVAAALAVVVPQAG